MKVTVLGCGASGGVPLIGCDCPVCTSDNPKNKRTRASIIIEDQGQTILVDTSPDLRQQLLANGITKVDAIIYTHAHADHCHGIDDIRSLNYKKQGPISAYMDAATKEELLKRFSYAFQKPIPEYGWFRPSLEIHDLAPFQSVTIGTSTILPFPQRHGRHTTLGLRIGNFAYSTDTNGLGDEAFSALKGISHWIVDCLQLEPSPTHADLEMALSWIKKVGPQHAWLTHMSHVFDYESLRKTLPSKVEPAWDGLLLEM